MISQHIQFRLVPLLSETQVA